MKQRLHPQSVADISRHSVLSEDRIQQCETSSGSRHTRTQISVCKSPFPSAGTAVSLFRAKTVQQRPLLPREVETCTNDQSCRLSILYCTVYISLALYLACWHVPNSYACCSFTLFQQSPDVATIFSAFLPRDVYQEARPMPSCGVCPLCGVCPSVRHVRLFCRNE